MWRDLTAYTQKLSSDALRAAEAEVFFEGTLENIPWSNALDDALRDSRAYAEYGFVYIIEEVGGEMQSTFEAFKKFKRENREYSLPKANTANRILYFGSSHSLKSRLNQHLAGNRSSTYALKLNAWFLDRKYRVYIRQYAVSREVIQIIEDGTALALQPAFGKRGGNGR